MRIAVSGTSGFIGSHLWRRLETVDGTAPLRLDRQATPEARLSVLRQADVVIHLAGVNRAADPAAFASGNVDHTLAMCDALAAIGRRTPIVFASSIQVSLDTPYGRSKRAAEDTLVRYADATGAPVRICRLPNVFGPGARPDYNTVVATFSHRLARGLPISIDQPRRVLRLVHVDDVIGCFLKTLATLDRAVGWFEVEPVHEITVARLAWTLERFASSEPVSAEEGESADLLDKLRITYRSYVATG